MRSQNIKVNNVGKVSCLLLLLLAFLVVNPVGSSAYAEEGLADGDVAPWGDDNPDAGLSAQAADASTVRIPFSPTAGSASLAPVNSAGQSAQIKVLATVNVQNSGGYSVYVKSNSQNLVGQKSSANTIPGLQGSATYTNLPVNTWGYTATEGTTISDNATYKAVSVTGNGDKIAENTSNKITSDTKTIALAFAARINDTKPVDTYRNTVTMSVVSSPIELALVDIEEMQQMTSAVCENTPTEPATGSSKQLKDVRDGKYYWVAKLADRKCWMTQNLDLDLSTNKVLTAADSDAPMAGYTPIYDTAMIADDDTVLADDTGQRSWSLGDYRIINPTISSNCGSGRNSAADCSSQFTAYTTPITANGDANAHYILGNHYQWNTATAGTGGSVTSGQALSSICPKGWRLPTSNTGGEFEELVTVLGGATSTDSVTNAPFYGVRGGDVSQMTDHLFEFAGHGGAYWSSTPDSNGSYAYYLNFYETASVEPFSDYYRQLGFSVRCIAR